MIYFEFLFVSVILQSVHNSLKQLDLMYEQISINRIFNTVVILLVNESANTATAASSQDLLRCFEIFILKMLGNVLFSFSS